MACEDHPRTAAFMGFLVYARERAEAILEFARNHADRRESSAPGT